MFELNSRTSFTKELAGGNYVYANESHQLSGDCVLRARGDLDGSAWRGAADFLLRLLDERVFSIEEVDEIATKVSIIINGIVERGQLSRPMTATVLAEEFGLAGTR